MKRRLFCLLAVLALVLAMQTTVFAHNTLDLTQDGKGSITINLGYVEDTTDFGSLLLLQVAQAQETDGDCAFVPTPELAPAWDEEADLRDPDFAFSLLAYAMEQGLEFDVHEVSADGTVVFEELKLGLYLVAQVDPAEGYEAINPFLIGVPNLADGVYTYQVEASPKVSVKPLPTEPSKPTEPAPTEPSKPTEPAPTEPKPSEPAPSEPEPEPSEPAPSEPVSEPAE